MIKYKSSLPIQGKIIYITVAVYLLTQLWRLFCLLFCYNGYDWQSLLALPANLHDLQMRPWTLITYMFCHADIGKNVLHIVFNMLWLWWLAPIYLRFHTSKQFLSLYLMSGIFAGVFFLIVYNIFPYSSFFSKFKRYIFAECKNKPNKGFDKNDFIVFHKKVESSAGDSDLGVVFSTGSIKRTVYLEALKEAKGSVKILYMSSPEIMQLIHSSNMLEEFKLIIDKQVQ